MFCSTTVTLVTDAELTRPFCPLQVRLQYCALQIVSLLPIISTLRAVVPYL